MHRKGNLSLSGTIALGAHSQISAVYLSLLLAPLYEQHCVNNGLQKDSSSLFCSALKTSDVIVIYWNLRW